MGRKRRDEYAKLATASKPPVSKEDYAKLVEAEAAAWEALEGEIHSEARALYRLERLRYRCPLILFGLVTVAAFVALAAFSCRSCWEPPPRPYRGPKAWAPRPPNISPPPPPPPSPPAPVLPPSPPLEGMRAHDNPSIILASSPSPPRASLSRRSSSSRRAPRQHKPHGGASRQLSTRPPPPLLLHEPAVADECSGWRNGTRDTWSDPMERRTRDSAPGGFTSQVNQDKLLWHAAFAHLGRTGRYIDCASNHFKRISNTYFLDRCAGWAGLCVEPNPIYHDGLRRHRTCKLAPTCATDAPVERDLLLPPYQWLGGLGGVSNGSLPSLLKGKRAPIHSFYPPHKWRPQRMQCTTLQQELTTLGWAHVDFLSLDVWHYSAGPARDSHPAAASLVPWRRLTPCGSLLGRAVLVISSSCPRPRLCSPLCSRRLACGQVEGHEASVLQGVDWTRTRIDYILCERGCAAALQPRGYRAQKLPPPPRKPSDNKVLQYDELLWTHPDVPPLVWRAPPPPQQHAAGRQSGRAAGSMSKRSGRQV